MNDEEPGVCVTKKQQKQHHVGELCVRIKNKMTCDVMRIMCCFVPTSSLALRLLNVSLLCLKAKQQLHQPMAESRLY